MTRIQIQVAQIVICGKIRARSSLSSCQIGRYEDSIPYRTLLLIDNWDFLPIIHLSLEWVVYLVFYEDMFSPV